MFKYYVESKHLPEIITINSFLITSIIILLIIFPPAISAKVKGVCSNCHTMHNSQNGTEVEDRSDTAFDPDDVQNYQVVNLLVNACIGCHSSTDSTTIIDIGDGTRIPIVYNTVAPSNPLAGGNFYWVEANGDEYGHNVRTIDGILDWAPGGDTGFVPVPNKCGFEGCHKSLASIRYAGGSGPPIIGNGCIGCHDPAHHANDEQHSLAGGYKYVDESGGGYRFLNKAGANYLDIPPHSSQPAVAGIEDPDWEQNPGPTSHNEYQDYPKPFAPGAYGGNPQGISDFCAGCHNTYHSWPAGGSPNGGDGSPWLRHPVANVLPTTGEYAYYTAYVPNVPIARSNGSVLSGYTGPSDTVTPGEDKVMCLSCHRAHGSEYKDMLRWNYEDMEVGTTDSGAGTGCFTCHTGKDGL